MSRNSLGRGNMEGHSGKEKIFCVGSKNRSRQIKWGSMSKTLKKIDVEKQNENWWKGIFSFIIFINISCYPIIPEDFKNSFCNPLPS